MAKLDKERNKGNVVMGMEILISIERVTRE